MNELHSAWKEKGGRKIELIEKQYIFTNQISSHVNKIANKKAKLSGTERFI